MTLLANERNYLLAGDPRINAALTARYYLSDDYYAGLLPLPYLGGELYIPQVALGRLQLATSLLGRQVEPVRNDGGLHFAAAMV